MPNLTNISCLFAKGELSSDVGRESAPPTFNTTITTSEPNAICTVLNTIELVDNYYEQEGQRQIKIQSYWPVYLLKNNTALENVNYLFAGNLSMNSSSDNPNKSHTFLNNSFIFI